MSDSDPSRSKALALPPWRSALARALHRNRSRPYSRYFQLATITPAGRPTNRTVVFRGWLPNTNSLTFVTDQRSAKVADIAAHPWAEACWYFTSTREQFRLAGPSQVVSATDLTLAPARQTAWADLSDQARQQFYWPHPAQSRCPNAAFAPPETPPENQPENQPETPPDNFSLVLLTPHEVDHLELRGDPQNRTLYICQPDDTWQVEAVNP